MMQSKIAHLQLIQNALARLANTSASFKSWAVTIVAACFALSSKDSDPRFLYLALVPILAFWIVDGYYLQQERSFRALYDEVAKKNEQDIDFLMTTSRGISWLHSMFAAPNLVFYGMIASIVITTSLVLTFF